MMWAKKKAWLELFRTFAEKEMIDKVSERIKPNLDIEKKNRKDRGSWINAAGHK